MTDTTTSPDVLIFPEEDKLPSMLKTLTILTYIGCAIAAISAIATPFLMSFSTKMMDKAMTRDGITDKQLADLQNSKTIMEITQQYMIPIMAIAVIGTVLCFIGARMMRKLKKDGFWLYTAGEILPVISTVIFLGKYAFLDWKSIFNYLFPAVMIVLYATQLKYLVKK